jgi:outer membrane protein, multidrug efflux system
VKTKRECSPRGKTVGGLFIFVFLITIVPSLVRAQEEVLTLEQAIQLALRGNERALAADQNLAAADARLTKARAYFMPAINATGTYTRRPFEVQRTIGNQQIIVQNLNALSGVASFSMILFDSHSIPTLVQASSDRSAEQYATADAKRVLAFEVSNAYLMTLSVDQVLEASNRRFDFAKQNLEAAKARYSAGLVSSNDVTRAELESATAEMGVTQVRGQVETTYLQLGYLLNNPARRRLMVPEFLLSAVEGKPLAAEALIAEAQARRPDVTSLRWRAKSQHALIVEPILKWLPSLSLTGRYTYTNEAGLTGQNTNWNAGLTMSWSIFDGFTRNGEYSERRALAYQADLNLQSAMRLVELEVRDSLVILANEQAALKQATVAFEVAKRNAAETTELYRQGLATALQVADANVSLFEAEVQLVSSRYGVGIAYLNLEAALGLDPFGKEPKIEN